MDSIFWTGLLIGALLSVPLSITSNLWTDPVRDYLLKRRTLRLNKQKSKELEDHELAKGLRDGNALAMLTVQGYRDHATRMTLYSVLMIGLVSSFVTVGVTVAPDDPRTFNVAFSAAVIVLLSSGFALLSSAVTYSHVGQLVEKAHSLEEYVREIRAKWGGDAV